MPAMIRHKIRPCFQKQGKDQLVGDTQRRIRDADGHQLYEPEQDPHPERELRQPGYLIFIEPLLKQRRTEV